MIRTFRYPLHVNCRNDRVLRSWLELCRSLYNGALEHREEAWKRARHSVSYQDQTAELTEIRAQDPEWEAIPVVVSRSALRRLDRSFKAFFRRVKLGDKPGFPRFQGRRRYCSFSIGRALPQGDRVRIPKLGLLRFHRYRPLKGDVLETQIRRHYGRWYVCFACDLGPEPEKRPAIRRVGIDLGLTHFAVTSDGQYISNPRWYRRGEARLARRQRAMARSQKGSRTHWRRRFLVARAHQHIQNQRLDHARKLACSLFGSYDVVSVEALNIGGMVQGWGLGKSIADAGWRIFLSALRHKAAEAGAWVVEVDPRGTSVRCSACGVEVPK